MQAITSFLNKQQKTLKNRVTHSSMLSHRVALNQMFVNGERCVIIENDAINCDNRILKNVASLVLS